MLGCIWFSAPLEQSTALSYLKELSLSIGSTLFSQVFKVTTSFLFFAWFNRLLSKSEMALYAFQGTITSWVLLAAGLGMATVTVRDVPGLEAAGKQDEAKAMISACLYYFTFLAVLTAIALWFLAPWLNGIFFEQTDVYMFRLVVVISLVFALVNQLNLIQTSRQAFRYRALCEISTAFFSRFLALIGFYQWGFTGFLIGFGAGAGITLVLHMVSLVGVLTRKIPSPLAMIRNARAYLSVDVLRNLLLNLDRPIVLALLGEATLADYFVASRFAGFLKTASWSVIGPLGAKFSEISSGAKEKLGAFFTKSLSLVAYVFLPAGAVVAVMSEPILRIIGGEKYISAAPLLTAFGLVIAAQGVADLIYEGVYRLLPPSELIKLNVALFTSNYGGYLILLPILGVLGAPLATGASWVTGFLWGRMRLQRANVDLSIHMSQFLQPACCALLSGLSAWVALGIAGSSISRFILLSPIPVIVWALFILKLGPPEAGAILNKIRGRLHV